MLLFVEDVLQLFDQSSDFLCITGLGLSQTVLVSFLCSQHLTHHDLDLSPKISILFPQQVELLCIIFVVVDEDAHVALNLSHLGRLFSLERVLVVIA